MPVRIIGRLDRQPRVNRFLAAVDADQPDVVVRLERLRSMRRPKGVFAGTALGREDPPRLSGPAEIVDFGAVVAAGVDSESRHPKLATARCREDPQKECVEFLPSLRLRRILIDDLVDKRPAFLIDTPADQLNLQPIALHVAKPCDDLDVIRQVVGAVGFGPGDQVRTINRLAFFPSLAQHEIDEGPKQRWILVDPQPFLDETRPGCVWEQAVTGPDVEASVPIHRPAGAPLSGIDHCRLVVLLDPAAVLAVADKMRGVRKMIAVLRPVPPQVAPLQNLHVTAMRTGHEVATLVAFPTKPSRCG